MSRTPWTGKIGMVGVDTIDGRRINPAGISLPEPAQIGTLTRAEQLGHHVGELTEIRQADGGELRGAGWVDASLLPPGRQTFRCGLEVAILRMETDPEHPTDNNVVLVIEERRVRRLVLYLDPDIEPAWPGCEITLAH